MHHEPYLADNHHISVNANDVIVINGIKYAGEFFQHFASAEIGAIGKIIKRQDGAVTVERVEAFTK